MEVKKSVSYKERPIKCTDKDGNIEYFFSLSRAAREKCILPVNITQAVNKVHKTAGGLVWEYTDGKKGKELVEHKNK